VLNDFLAEQRLPVHRTISTVVHLQVLQKLLNGNFQRNRLQFLFQAEALQFDLGRIERVQPRTANLLRLFPDASFCGLLPLAPTFGLRTVIQQHGLDALAFLPVVSFIFILAAAILAVVPYEERSGPGHGVHGASIRYRNQYARIIAWLSIKMLSLLLTARNLSEKHSF
jgi:hypothetical protein